MTRFEAVLYEKQGPVAWVTLNRPWVLNAFNTTMRDELFQVLEAVRDDSEVRGVVLKGAGDRAFCAGADLTEFGTAPSQAVARRTRWERDVWGLFLSMRKPLVAALQGYVLGSGTEMVLLCDERVATEDAVFGLPEVALGMIPAAGGSQTLPRTIGPARAMEVLMTGRRLGAEEALEMGLVSRVVPRESLLTEAQALLERMIRHDPLALALAKGAVQEGLDLPLEQGLALEARYAARMLGRRGAGRWQPQLVEA